MARSSMVSRLGIAILSVHTVVALTDISSAQTVVPEGNPSMERVSALGRIDPHNGVFKVAGPPRAAVVIKELLVDEGDSVDKDQIVAVLLGIEVLRAEVARLEAELSNAEWEVGRNRELFKKRTISESDLRSFELARDVAAASLERARAELLLSSVRSPISGQVIEIHAREGERVEANGIMEIADTAAMYAIAEVYETDIGHVRVNQRAVVRSPALPRPLEGVVERIGLKIGKQDVLSTDPVADADARVVEVDIRLANPELAASLTNLRVDVIIETGRDGDGS